MASAHLVDSRAGAETTRLLAAPPSPPIDPADTGDTKRPSGMVLAAAGLSLLAVSLVILGLTTSNEDSPTDARPVDSTTTTVAPTSTTNAPTSTTIDTTTTSLSSSAARVAETRDQLEAELSRPPRTGFNPPEVADLMEWVDEAIVAAGEGDADKAEERLGEVDRRLREKLDGERLDETRRLLFELAEMLDVEIDAERGRGDDERGRDDDD